MTIGDPATLAALSAFIAGLWFQIALRRADARDWFMFTVASLITVYEVILCATNLYRVVR